MAECSCQIVRCCPRIRRLHHRRPRRRNLGVRGNRRLARADIKSAPTAPPPVLCRGGLYGRPDQLPIPAGVRVFLPRRGAYKIRPYNPSVTLRVTAPFAQGSLPSQASGLTAFGDGASDAAALFTCHTPPAGVKMHNSPMRVVHFTWRDRPQASSSVSSILRNTDTSSVLLT